MNKYYELLFDGVSYLDFTDETKGTVKRVTESKDNLDEKFCHVYFEQKDGEECFKELGSQKRFVIKPGTIKKEECINLGYTTFTNASFNEVDRTRVLLGLRNIMGDSNIGLYSTFMNKLFTNSSLCQKLINDHEAKIDRRSFRNSIPRIRTNGNSYAEARLYELQKQSLLLRMNKDIKK